MDSARAASVREHVLALLPTASPSYREAFQAGKFYCVVEKHDTPFDFGAPDPESFLWLCAKPSLPIKKMFTHYRKRCPEGDDDFVMTVAGDDQHELEADGDAKFKDLPAPTDGILLLTATRKLETPSKPPRSSSPRMKTEPQRTPLRDQHPNEQSRLPSTETKPSMSAPSGQSESENVRAIAPSSAGAANVPLSVEAASVAAVPADPVLEESQYQPRELANPFLKDEPEQDLPTRGGPLAQLTNEETPERLEAAVQAGLKVLFTLEAPLKDMPRNEDTAAWLEQIGKVREAATKTRTVVGVVGNTGAGKSSVINAMLDEERLVPTNCMRACTAVVTELSYNYSDNPATKYRAEIEFIKPEDWRKELTVLFEEIFDDNGQVSKDVYSADSEAGIAYAKVRAVYHKLSKEDLTRTSVEKLMRNKKVQSLLGSSKTFSTREPRPFYDKLQLYVDSKEKGTEKLDKNGNVAANQPRPFESWPLIKVVKIYTKSPALSTGAVIVDLPGVHDSNAARSAVAQGYMKQCTGLWIVAPINRAVDDKAAKTLMGDTFKRQLKFDGTYSAVSFICSKTDDISLTEATDSLNLGARMADLDNKGADIDARHLSVTKEFKDLKNSIRDHEESMKHIEDEEEVWEELEDRLAKGRTVFAPSAQRQNRKRKSSDSGSSPPARKRRRRTIDSDDDGEDSDQERDQAEDNGEAQDLTGDSSKHPLSEDEITTKLDELKTMYKEARREKKTLESQAVELRKSLRILDDEAAEIDTLKTGIAIEGRNNYSRGAIRQDFAAGIRELDQEAAEDEDPDAFDPSENLRDYDQVAASLPVFCVSSRAYQKLSGRMKKDNNVPGYSMLAETEIPQLQAHCKKLTEKGRQASCRRFLNSMKQLLGSLGLWASDDGTGIKLTATQQDIEKSILSKKLKDLEKTLEKVVNETMTDAVDTIDDQLFAKFPPAAYAAAQEALPRAQGWGAHRSNGGLHWGTYRATTRRSGVWAGPSGARDFNADLTEPMYKTLGECHLPGGRTHCPQLYPRPTIHLLTLLFPFLGGVWEKAFQRRIPNILQSLKKSATNVLKQFHVVVEDRARKSGHGLARIGKSHAHSVQKVR